MICSVLSACDDCQWDWSVSEDFQDGPSDYAYIHRVLESDYSDSGLSNKLLWNFLKRRVSPKCLRCTFHCQVSKKGVLHEEVFGKNGKS